MSTTIESLLLDEFPSSPARIHLNHAAVAPWPARAVRAVEDFARANLTGQPYSYANWLSREQLLREQARWLLNAAYADEIALLKNTSEALSMVALGLRFNPGENVVTSDQEFPSNRLIWQRLDGVELREAKLDEVASPEEALETACDSKTRLLTISAVQYASGLRMDLERLGRFCRSRNILFCVDAIQQLGALPFDAPAIQADFVMADGHKWLLGPEGLAIFYCARQRLDTLRVLEYGWHSVEHPEAFERRDQKPAASARRFECGSPNMLGIHALSASLSLFEELGMKQVSTELMGKITYLLELLQGVSSVQILSCTKSERRSGILSLAVPGIDVKVLQKELLNVGVVCAARSGRLRLSPHFYTPAAHLEYAVEQLCRLLP